MKNRVGFILHHCVLTLVILPLLLAACGALVEFVVYKPESNPHFHVKWMPISGLIAAPFILVHVLWRWNKHLLKLEFCIYVVQLVVYFLTVNQAVIVGPEYYQANHAFRVMMTTDDRGVDLFQAATTKDKTWQWLEHAVETIFSSDAERALRARVVGESRLVLLGSLRLRQHRVTPACCSRLIRLVLTPALGTVCYPPFSSSHESRATYGTNLTFNYSDIPVLTETGHFINTADFSLGGTHASYPRAGFSTFFPPGIRKDTALSQLRAMRDSQWIDKQTRAIVVELGLTAADFLSRPVWAAATFLLESSTIGRFVPNQPTVHFNYFSSVVDDSETLLAGGQPLETCVQNVSNQSSAASIEEQAMEPPPDSCQESSAGVAAIQFYVGIASMANYTFYMAWAGLLSDWKKFLKDPFSWSNVIWGALLAGAWSMMIYSARRSQCGSGTFRQPPFVGLNESDLDWVLTSYATSAEYHALAAILTTMRRLLALSIFLQIFNSLRFLVRLKSLGMMVRTLYFSSWSLVSFSISFLVMFFGFVVMFYFFFSLDAEDFQDIPRTIVTLWLGMLGEMQITSELYRAKEWSIALIIGFTFISTFVLLTVIISIISNAHEKAQHAAACDTAIDRPKSTVATPRRNSNRSTTQFTDLVSETEILSSTIQKWKAATLRVKGTKVSPGDDQIVLTEAAASSVELAGTDSHSTSSQTSLHSRRRPETAEAFL